MQVGGRSTQVFFFFFIIIVNPTTFGIMSRAKQTKLCRCHFFVLKYKICDRRVVCMHAFVRVDYILDHYYLACIVVIGLVINMIESYYANDPVTCYDFARVC